MAVANLYEALAHGTLKMWCGAVERPVSFGIAEAAHAPLWTILIHMVHPILVILPAIVLGNARAHLFFSFLDPSLSHTCGSVAMTPFWLQSTVATRTYAVVKAMMNLLLLVSIMT